MPCLRRCVRYSSKSGHPSKSPFTFSAATLTTYTSASLTKGHETIYNAIYAMPRGELRKDLIALMRRAQAKQMPRSRGEERRGKIVDMLGVHCRPPEARSRLFPGHWESDLIKGKGNASAVGSLVERSSRLLMLVLLPGPKPGSAAAVLEAFTQKLRSIALPTRQSLTHDQGGEMARHKELVTNANIVVYFCDPHSS